MKLAFRDIQPFLKKPNPNARVILVYGPDSGLVTARTTQLAKTQIPDLSDPFALSNLTGDQITSDPARLNDEAFAASLMGGERLVLIKDATDAITPTLKTYLTNPSPHTCVIISAGELGTRSTLRALVEKAKNAAAVPCYLEDARDISRNIQAALAQHNLQIEYAAQTLLADSLIGDHGVANSEIDKLITYKLSDPDKTVRVADVIACMGDVRAHSFDELIHAVGLGNVPTMSTTLTTLLRDSIPPVAILRALQNHFRRLYQTQLSLENGLNIKEAMKSLHPPVFFKFENDFSAQIRRWPKKRIEQILERLAQTEAETKKTDIPAETITAKLLLDISLL